MASLHTSCPTISDAMTTQKGLFSSRRAKMHIAGVDRCQRLRFSCAIGVLIALKKRNMTP
jgi:hypothetical protein